MTPIESAAIDLLDMVERTMPEATDALRGLYALAYGAPVPEPTPAAVAINALLDADTEGEVAETLYAMLTFEELPDDREWRYVDALSLLIGRVTNDEMNALHLSVDICPVHACDIAICADDDVTECAALRASPAQTARPDVLAASFGELGPLIVSPPKETP